MKIIGCGCSWTHGFYWGDIDKTQISCNTSYIKFLTEKLQCDSINIAFPGASNYAIAKQVEYAISCKPDLIIFNTTTHSRINLKKINAPDFRESELSIRSFDYGQFKNKHIDYHDNTPIYSGTFNFFVTKKTPVDTTDSIKKFILTYDEYVDPKMRKDQDKLLIKGILETLQQSNIPYICIDFMDMLPIEYNSNLITVSMVDILFKNYPIDTDETHFNQDGHKFISELIYQQLTKNNIL